MWLDRRGEPGSVVAELLAAAAAAPSVHNTQPWLFRPHHGGIDIYADRDRQLRVIDPTGRELYLSVGAAIFNLRVAILRRGWTPQLRLCPRPTEPDLLARVGIGARLPASRSVRALAAAIAQRRSNRWPFLDQSVPTSVLAELRAAAAAEGAALTMADPGTRRAVLDAARAAEDLWSADPRYQRELAEWTMDRPGRTDGVARLACGPRSVDDALPLRDFGSRQSPRQRPTVAFEARPVIAVLRAGDGPTQWLRAGQALQRVLLTATVRGLATSLLTQPLEVPWLRDGLADPVSGRPAQAVVRLGYSRRSVGGSPRRSPAAVLVGPDTPAGRRLR